VVDLNNTIADLKVKYEKSEQRVEQLSKRPKDE
jgi:YbbR domain-containing protein